MKEYLGDAVYAEFDGYYVILTTENGEGPSNRILLEPAVMTALAQFKTRVDVLVTRALGEAQ